VAAEDPEIVGELNLGLLGFRLGIRRRGIEADVFRHRRKGAVGLGSHECAGGALIV
jgi:hypothetical protein